LILWKIIKIAATRCHILKLKCTKFDFGWGSAPDPAGELTPLAGFEGPTSKGRGGRGGFRGEGGREGKRRGGDHTVSISKPLLVSLIDAHFLSLVKDC